MIRKVKVIFYIFLTFSLLFLFRLFYLQVWAGAKYSHLATFQSIRRIVLKAPRGRIFDRKGRILADVKPSFSLAIVPREMDSLTQEKLERIVTWDKDLIAENRNSYSPVEIMANIPMKKVIEMEEGLSGLRGVRLEVKPIRSYSHSFLFHVLGNVNKITKEEWERDKSYERSDFIGKVGIEKWYEKILRGKDGFRLVEVDARGKEIGNLPEVEEVRPVSGCDLYLSLDLELLCLVDSLFSPYQRGSCVAIDPRDGRVLIFYSKPYLDPNLFLSSFPPEVWERIKNHPGKPFFNRVIQAQFPPGSTFKPLIALAGLKKGVLRRDSRFIPCAGGFKFGNRYFRCWTAHGSLGLIDAIAQSCNTYFYQAGLAIGLEEIIKMAEDFNFGRKTGIDLLGEEEGILPTPAYLDRKYGGRYPKGIVLNLAIGQGEIAVTPLQLAFFYCAIAQKGKIYRPHLVDSIKFPCRSYHSPFLDSLARFNFVPKICGGDTIYIFVPSAEEIDLPEEYFKVIDDALEFVVERGTGRGTFIPEVKICGKTGTAENPFGQDHAWFVGYGPKGNPSIVLCVLVENIGKGGAYAVPIANRIFRRYFNLSGEGEVFKGSVSD
ncbi:MAG: penicillin-binding protein 2 [candidate division WOR-3 bacterium]